MNDTGTARLGDGSTRERLIRAALAVVADAGISGATSRQIAAAAGTNLQAITYHFGSKDDLVAEALVTVVREWLAPARRALDGLADDPVGGLLRALTDLQAAIPAALPNVPAYLEALALVPRSPTFRERIRQLMADLRHDLARTLQALKDVGFLAGWVDPEAMAALVLAAADGVAVHLSIEAEALDVDDVLAQVVPLLLSASALAPPPD